MSGSVNPADEQHTLEIPPRPEYVSTARLFLAAIARHYRCDEETIEDLKVAVSEACNNAIGAHVRAGTADAMRLTVRALGNTLEVETLDRGGGLVLETNVAHEPPELSEGGLGLVLIRSLFPEARITSDDQGTRVSLAVPAGAANV